jgi:hypothetical protein
MFGKHEACQPCCMTVATPHQQLLLGSAALVAWQCNSASMADKSLLASRSICWATWGSPRCHATRQAVWEALHTSAPSTITGSVEGIALSPSVYITLSSSQLRGVSRKVTFAQFTPLVVNTALKTLPGDGPAQRFSFPGMRTGITQVLSGRHKAKATGLQPGSNQNAETRKLQHSCFSVLTLMHRNDNQIQPREQKEPEEPHKARCTQRHSLPRCHTL